MDALTFQTQLEQLFEEDRKVSSQEPTNLRFTTQIGALLLQGKEFLSAEEYRAALDHCGVTPAMENKAIEICKLSVLPNALTEAMQAGGIDAVLRYTQGETEAQFLERIRRAQKLFENEQE